MEKIEKLADVGIKNITSQMNIEPELLKELETFKDMKPGDKIMDIYQNMLYGTGCLKILRNLLIDEDKDVSREDIIGCVSVVSDFFDLLISKLNNLKSSI